MRVRYLAIFASIFVVLAAAYAVNKIRVLDCGTNTVYTLKSGTCSSSGKRYAAFGSGSGTSSYACIGTNTYIDQLSAGLAVGCGSCSLDDPSGNKIWVSSTSIGATGTSSYCQIGASEGSYCKMLYYDSGSNNVFESGYSGKYDPDDNYCVYSCTVNNEQYEVLAGSGITPVTTECEVACGADAQCDEIFLGGGDVDLGEGFYCTSSCAYRNADSSDTVCAQYGSSFSKATSWLTGDEGKDDYNNVKSDGFCCGDDSNEYALTCSSSTTKVSCGGSTVCCDTSTDCVGPDGKCYANGQQYNGAYCVSGNWQDSCAVSQEGYIYSDSCKYFSQLGQCSGDCTGSCYGTGWTSYLSCSCGSPTLCPATLSGNCKCELKFIIDEDSSGSVTTGDTCTDTISSGNDGKSCAEVTPYLCSSSTLSGQVSLCSGPADVCTTTDYGCRYNTGQCIYGGNTYDNGAVITLSGKKYTCSGGTWACTSWAENTGGADSNDYVCNTDGTISTVCALSGGYYTYITNSDSNTCEVGCGADSFCDEQTPGYYGAGGGNGCPTDSECLCAYSPACQAYDRDATQSVCESGGLHNWIPYNSLGNYGNTVIDSTGCSGDVSCGDGNPSTGFCCGDDTSENYRTCTSSDPGSDACTASSVDVACCDSGNDCIYNGVCYDSGTWQDVDADGYREYCSSGAWAKAPDGTACTYGEECSSGLCVNGYCRSSCSGYDIQPVSNDTNAYTTNLRICADYNDTDGTVTVLPGLYADFPYIVDEGNTVSSGGWFDLSDNPSIYTKIYTKTGAPQSVAQAKFYCRGPGNQNEDTGYTPYTASSSPGTLSLVSNFGSGYGQYACWPGAGDGTGECCYNIGSGGANDSTSRRSTFNADDISLTCSISCSSNQLVVSFTASHQNSGNTNTIGKKGCQGTSSCETATGSSVCGTTGTSCAITAAAQGGVTVYGYANDTAYPWIDTDSAVSCGTVPDLDTSSCWCAAGGKSWLDLDSNAGTTADNCCGDDPGESFADATESSSQLCYSGQVKTCTGSNLGEAWLIGSEYYFCINDGAFKWVKAATAADYNETACTNVSGTWTGNECCGNLADTDGDDASVTGTEGTDNYRDGDWGCWNGVAHNCDGSSNTCFGLNLNSDPKNDTWCIAASKWVDWKTAADVCSEACENNEFSTSYLYLGSQCCGDNAGEKNSTKIASDCSYVFSPIKSNMLCCTGNSCYKDGSGCVPEGDACGNYICDDSEWKRCSNAPGDICNWLDLDNDGYADKFCDNSTATWKLASDTTDLCQGAGEALGGIWTGRVSTSYDISSNSQSCCSSQDTGVWCLATSDRVTKCDSGTPIDCKQFCDESGNVTDGTETYTCTSAFDQDCTSNACSGSDCSCKKGEGTGCYTDSACASGNCASFSVDQSSYFKSLSNPGSYSGICCPSGSCPYDRDGDGTVDSCASSGTASIDADHDGDFDYCESGTWKECQSYSCTSAAQCGCMGNSTLTGFCNYFSQPAGTYSTGTGLCNLQNSTQACGTPCDANGDTGSREYVNLQGLCTKGGGSCLDIYQSYSWFGNSSLSFVNVSVDCLCSSQAACTVNVYNSSGLHYSTSKTVSGDGAYGLIALSEPFSVGQNRVELNCSCSGAVPSGCTQDVATLDYTVTTITNSSGLKVGNDGYVYVRVSNTGDVPLAGFSVGVLLTSGAASVSNTTAVSYLAAGASTTLPIKLAIPITMYNSTTQTLSNHTSVLIFSNVTDISLMASEQGSTYTYQCSAASDCPTACPSPAGNCWAYGGASNFSCSYGVCCPAGQQFENGACCPTGYGCCVTDSACASDEWCANSSSYSSYGVEWACNDLLLNGQSCGEDRMCDSANCEAASVGGKTYCCSAVTTVTEAGGECSTLNGDVCKSGGCCTADSECSSGEWCSLFGNRCVSCPDSNDAGYFNGYCASSNCVGTDADCCSTDSDCSKADSILGRTNATYCNVDTYTCEECTTSLDYYCPSMRCYEAGAGTGDPDCCKSDADCLEGSTCSSGTCVPKNMGKYCTADADCGVGTGLVCTDNRCVLENFLIVSPTSFDISVGEVRYANIIIRDPQLRQDSYTLGISGQHSQFAKLPEGKSTTVTLGPGESKKYTLAVFGGAAVSGGQIKVYASSNTVGGLSNEKAITLNIARTGGSSVVNAAPGISVWEGLAILAIGGALAWGMRKL